MIAPKGTNITGMYRVCKGTACKTLVSCPYVMCRKHWIAVASVDNSEMTEIIDTASYI
jgi:hypothetical protein